MKKYISLLSIALFLVCGGSVKACTTQELNNFECLTWLNAVQVQTAPLITTVPLSTSTITNLGAGDIPYSTSTESTTTESTTTEATSWTFYVDGQEITGDGLSLEQVKGNYISAENQICVDNVENSFQDSLLWVYQAVHYPNIYNKYLQASIDQCNYAYSTSTITSISQ